MSSGWSAACNGSVGRASPTSLGSLIMTINRIRVPTPRPIPPEETLRRIDEQIEAVWIKTIAAAEEKYPGILAMLLRLQRSRRELGSRLGDRRTQGWLSSSSAPTPLA